MLLAITELWAILLITHISSLGYVLSVNLFLPGNTLFTSAVLINLFWFRWAYGNKSQIAWSDAEWKTKEEIIVFYSHIMQTFRDRLNQHFGNTLAEGEELYTKDNFVKNISINVR